MPPVNVFIVGMEEHNLRVLERMPGAERYRFHPVLTYDEIYGGGIDFESSLAAAQHVLDAAPVPIDTIIGFWDFPVSALVPLLRQRYGLTSVPLTELLMCEHKYWSRLVQREVITAIPAFALVDPHAEPVVPPGLSFPMWLKPVKSFASVLAFGVVDARAYSAAIGEIRERIEEIGAPFEALLEHVDLPPEILQIGGQMCLAEEAIEGRQLTVEGYRFRGEVQVYGVVDSVRYPGSPSFLRYQYPSSVPAHVSERLEHLTRRVITRIGLESSPFNIEYFWDPTTDRVTLLEINPRHSQSHAKLFADVDGVTNHHVALRLSLGQEPSFPHRQGAYRIAAKCFVRHFTDGVVRRHPSEQEISALERAVPGTAVTLGPRAGDRLSEMEKQDSYSFELASIDIAAHSEAELVEKFTRIEAGLGYEIDEC